MQPSPSEPTEHEGPHDRCTRPRGRQPSDRLLHDMGRLGDRIEQGGAKARQRFEALKPAEQQQLPAFLQSI